MPDIPSEGLTERALAEIALENSGRTLALWALGQHLAAGRPAAPTVIAGQGAAGAAALAAARQLFNWGLEPRVLVVGMRERLRAEAAGALRLLERYGGRCGELLNADQAREAVESLPAGAALVYGVAGDQASQRATATSDLVNSLGAGRPASRPARFSVRFRTAAPEPGEPRVAVRAAPRDREAMRLMDSTAIREYGVPSLALMENAGFWAARELWRRLADPKTARVAVLAGKGNNGGDGLVIARHLAWWGVGAVTVYLAGRAGQLVDDARVNHEYAAAPGVPVVEVTGSALDHAADLEKSDWLVDALLGTGVAGRVRGASAELLAAAAGLGRPVLAVDTPSGLDASDGHLHGPALPATVTVSFGAPKTGFELGEGPRVVGELVVAEISLPRRITGAETEFVQGE